MTTPSDYFTFGAARYRPVLSAATQHTAVPMAPLVGEWLHVPYGGNSWVTDGTRQQTTWNVPIMLFNQDDYDALVALYGQTATLTTPFGTKTALLQEIGGMQYRPADGSYQGTVTWAWA